MRRLVLAVLFAGVAVVTGVLWSAATNVSAAVAPASELLAPATPGDAAPATVMQEGPAVTVRVGNGRNKVKVGGNDQNRGKKGRVEVRTRLVFCYLNSNAII